MKKDIVEFQFEGEAYEVDRAAITDYRTLKAIARVADNPAGYFDAMERVFMGEDEAYAEKVGGNEGMARLFNAAAAAANAKN